MVEALQRCVAGDPSLACGVSGDDRMRRWWWFFGRCESAETAGSKVEEAMRVGGSKSCSGYLLIMCLPVRCSTRRAGWCGQNVINVDSKAVARPRGRHGSRIRCSFFGRCGSWIGDSFIGRVSCLVAWVTDTVEHGQGWHVRCIGGSLWYFFQLLGWWRHRLVFY